jgi:hypothetical protein
MVSAADYRKLVSRNRRMGFRLARPYRGASLTSKGQHEYKHGRERRLTDELIAVAMDLHSRECPRCGLPYVGSRFYCERCMKLAAAVIAGELPRDAISSRD